MRLEWIGPVFDSSGYGAASRNYVLALHSVGVDVSLRPIAFEAKQPDLGADGDLLRSLVSDIPGTVRVIHATPDTYEGLLRHLPPIRTIGYAAWETSRLPLGWAEAINAHCSELWVPSRHNVEAFQASGVTIPVHRVPHCFAEPVMEPSSNRIEKSDAYRFLSVFQWSMRKGIDCLLRAYFTEFAHDEKVSLVLKTYLVDNGSCERTAIKGYIQDVKKALWLAAYPPVELIVSSMSSKDMNWLYRDCDAYASLHRCEGFGIPIAEAMLAGKPVICTGDGAGGPEDFVTHGADGYLVRSQPTPVYGMDRPTYNGSMVWREPNIVDARKWMRQAFGERHTPLKSAMGNAAKAHVLDELSFAKVGEQMKALIDGSDRRSVEYRTMGAL